jgi:GAF domain-containing protein
MSTRPDIVLVRADGRTLPVDVALSTVGDGPERIAVASVRDTSAQRAAANSRFRENQFLAAMNEITTAFFEGVEIEESLRAIARQARNLLSADLAFLAVPHDDGESMHFVAVDGENAEKLEGQLVPRDCSVAGAVMRDGEPLLVANAETDRRVYRPVGWPDGIGPALTVPLHAREETLGSITVAYRHGRPMFQASDIALMKAYAAHGTIALLDARTQAQMRKVEVLEDRERVALAMHDLVINRISSASLTLHTLLASRLPAPTAARISTVIDELDAALSSIREAVFPR